MVFVNSMSDMFHKEIPEAFVRRVFQVMLDVDRHVYQVLTKRPARALRFWQRNQDLFDGTEVPPHIWLGTSIENEAVIHRLRHLQAVPAATRFLSCEPLLGPLDLDLTEIHWVIVGGESGPEHRPMDEEWIAEIHDRCRTASVPFFFKQWGGHTPKAGGRTFRGQTWDEYPGLTASKDRERIVGQR